MRYLTLFLFTLCITFIFSQKNAITDTGDEVILYEDGTWEYKNNGKGLPPPDESGVIPTNTNTFEKPESASFLLKSDRINLGFWLNPKKWTFKKAISNEDAEYELRYKDGDVYGMIITEQIGMPLSTLKSIALENGRIVAPDLKIVTEEYREVNGNKVLFLQMDGTTQGIKFSFYGYYYSNDEGTVQFVTYTAQNLLQKHKEACEKLVNGLVVIEN